MDFKHTSIKQSALGWVKKSIDDNLTIIRRELDIYIEEKEASVLLSVQQKIKDLQGVLSMIEQYGAAMLAEEMSSLCQYIAAKEQQDLQALEVLLRAVLQLPDYLEHIQAGHKDIPFAILPLLNDIRAAKNEDLFSEKLLFLPDLSMHGDDGDYDAIDENKNQATRLLAKKLRPSYQFSILGLIKEKDVEINLRRVSKITEIMEERSSSEQVARLWWIVGALVESLARDNLPLGVSVKMLLGKVDQVFRSMILKGEKEIIRVQPIELIKNLLFYVAQPECDGPKSQAIKTAYRLEYFLPSPEDQAASSISGPNQELLKTVSEAVQADLEQVKSSLEVYVNGDVKNTSLLESIPRDLHVISDTLAMIGLGPQRQLIEAQIDMVSRIVEGSEEPDSEKLLAMAAELIQIDQALELMQKGQYHQTGEEATSATASRNFEMDNMLSGVIAAALDDIQKIKSAILDFIRDSSKEENIEFCSQLLNETRGALSLLNEDRATSVVDGLIEYLRNQDVAEFMVADHLDQLSQVVVSIEYYLEAVGEQRSDADSILDFADTQLQLLLEGKAQHDALIEAEQQALGNLLIDNEDEEEIEEIDPDIAGIEVSFGSEETDSVDSTTSDELADLDDITEIEMPEVQFEEAPFDSSDRALESEAQLEPVAGNETGIELEADLELEASAEERDESDTQSGIAEPLEPSLDAGPGVDQELSDEIGLASIVEATSADEPGQAVGQEPEVDLEPETTADDDIELALEPESSAELESDEPELAVGQEPEIDLELETETNDEIELEPDAGLEADLELPNEIDLSLTDEVALALESELEPEAWLEPEVAADQELELELQQETDSSSIDVEESAIESEIEIELESSEGLDPGYISIDDIELEDYSASDAEPVDEPQTESGQIDEVDSEVIQQLEPPIEEGAEQDIDPAIEAESEIATELDAESELVALGQPDFDLHSALDNDSAIDDDSSMLELEAVPDLESEQRPGAADMDVVVNDINNGLQEIQGVLSSEADSSQDSNVLDDLSGDGLPEEVQSEEIIPVEASYPPEVESGKLAISPVDEDLIVLKPGCDPEIMEIYLEEAEEESENIRQHQQDWKLHPEDDNALKNIRRAFHTIKGSGRLVGALKIGEFAWDFESLLNRVLEKSLKPSEQLIDAVGTAAEALPQLVKELATGEEVTFDIPYIRGLARALAETQDHASLAIRTNAMLGAAGRSEPSAAADDGAGHEEGAQDSLQSDNESDDEEPARPADDTQSDSTDQGETSVADADEEETPPDPFVLSAMVDMPGGEVEGALSDVQEPESEETGLQIDPELLVIYQQEVESHLSTVNSALNRSSDDSGMLIPTEDLYRAIHTINGASRTADITSIGLLASMMEKPLKLMLEQGVGFDEEVLDLYRKGHDALFEMTEELVEMRRIPEMPEMLRADLESLMEQLAQHTVVIPEQHGQPSNQFVETLTMMNESVDSDYDDELVEIFIEEALELLDMSDHTLQTWAEQDGKGGDGADFGLVMELQRYLHTLKGGAKMAEFDEISNLSHELESMFIAVIDDRVDKSDDLIDVLHESFDLLSSQVAQAKNHQILQSSEDQVALLQQMRTGKPAIATETAGSSKNADQPSPVLVEESAGVNKEKDTQLAGLPTKKDAIEADRRNSDRDVVKVRSELLDNLVNSAGEVSIYRARIEQQVSTFGSNLGELGQTISRLKNQLRALEAETDAQIHFSHKDDADGLQNFDPLEMDRYTQIQQLSKSLSESVDDLSSLQTILGEQVKDSETLLLQQSRINTDLQDGLIRSRMVRFSGLTSRLRRLVRKTSSELAKKTELIIEGEQNEVDIKVLDRMLAPIEHILRNSISHGIESPLERVKKGKPETGVITIRVSRDGSDVVIKISDDGAGVNVRKVHARAIDLGLLDEQEELSDNDVIQFILEPGFSTADQVSQVAGRGVGMDVVNSGIKELGGTLQISTSPNGATFTSRLPFTLSINQAILVQVGDESYALPLINIEGITRIESDQMYDLYRQEKPTLDYAGQQYGLYYLSSLLEISREFHISDEMVKVPVILLRSGDLRVALHIDVLLGNREIVVKPLGKLLGQAKGISGATILADGQVVLILDINGLIRHGVSTQVVSTGATETLKGHVKDVRKTVMVVDDSITMRRVASKLLTRNNYDVVTAKDGVDALAQLEDVNPDVMLLDIEMPRMDGFELALHMKNEARYRDIPIIMITSRTGSKHRDHAMKLGVNKFMGKPYQEEELIKNISSLVG